jgi:phosphoribosylamine--glycine ligase
MERHGIPTARSGKFSDSFEAQKFAQGMPKPLVIKADGLALGKGVIIARTSWEAARAIHQIMDERRFGNAGQQIVIEEFLEGTECSIHALVDGRSYLLFPGAQDHKRAFDRDVGPNTGGMGTFSPAPALTSELEERVRREVLEPFLTGLATEGIDYRGMLFPGLMLTADGPKVLEFNCRFGDPETQVLLTRLESDLLDLLEATIDQRLDQTQPRWSAEAAVCVIMASGGYPNSYATGKPITGLDAVKPGITVFHAGTRMEEAQLVTAGGRVLGITALGSDLVTARERAYAAVGGIHFDGAHFRTDIAVKASRG